ncbi:MAG: hypothetical protein IBX48_06160 [Thiomicrospira sp.]|uniref:hypothetical protein n=1 Tax=Thiomicrospira sp. TaxID=935 RepID=UPI0019EA19FE|nr:hypothetical protein [Thiomicrospira sp.]MBE0493910.1 hypothetical protein [Thiomicrospira sp.]
MLKVAFFALFVALMALLLQAYAPSLIQFQELRETNQALTQKVEDLQADLALSQLEQERLKEALAKHEASKVNRLYE